MALNIAPIPMPISGSDAFFNGATKTQDIINSLMDRQLKKEEQADISRYRTGTLAQQAAELAQKKSYEGGLLDISRQKTPSDIALSNAQAAANTWQANLHRQQYDNPGLSDASGVAHDQAVLRLLLQKHPELVKDAHNQVLSSSIPAATSSVPPAQINLLQAAQAALQPKEPANMTLAAPSPVVDQLNPMSAAPIVPPEQPISSAQIQAPTIPQPGSNDADILQRNINAEIAEKEAKAKYYANGLNGGRGGVTLQQQKQLQTDVKRDNPTFDDDQVFEAAGNLLRGQSTLADGTPINASGLTQQDAINVQGSKATAAIKNQAANMDVLVDDLRDFDIGAITQFTGVNGKLKLAIAKAKMLANPNDPTIDPVARRYFTAMNQSILNMDQMRKSLGTSVVPKYVYETIGKLTNPNDSIWNDPKQVEQTYKALVQTMIKNRDTYMQKVRGGITAGGQSSSDEGTDNTSTESPTVKWARKDGKLVREE